VFRSCYPLTSTFDKDLLKGQRDPRELSDITFRQTRLLQIVCGSRSAYCDKSFAAVSLLTRLNDIAISQFPTARTWLV
jgi:hypothetical protein